MKVRRELTLNFFFLGVCLFAFRGVCYLGKGVCFFALGVCSFNS